MVIDKAREVLIPLNSGLVFVYAQSIDCDRSIGLNPFEFRAGICFRCQQVPAGASVLIPLNSGLVFVFTNRQLLIDQCRLNPFEFRAGICLQREAMAARNICLNPFEFRAGICFSVVTSKTGKVWS